MQLELGEDARDVPLHRGDRHDQRLGDPGIGTTLRHQREDLALPGAQPIDCASLASPTDEAGNYLRIQDRSAAGHAPHRLGETDEVADPVLQQVADSPARSPTSSRA